MYCLCIEQKRAFSVLKFCYILLVSEKMWFKFTSHKGMGEISVILCKKELCICPKSLILFENQDRSTGETWVTHLRADLGNSCLIPYQLFRASDHPGVFFLMLHIFKHTQIHIFFVFEYLKLVMLIFLFYSFPSVFQIKKPIPI